MFRDEDDIYDDEIDPDEVLRNEEEEELDEEIEEFDDDEFEEWEDEDRDPLLDLELEDED